MKNQLAFLLIGWAFLLSIPAQTSQKELDSLTTLLNRSDLNQQRVELLNLLSRRHRGKESRKAINYAEEARILSHRLSYTQGLGNALLNKGWALAGSGKSDSAGWYYTKSLQFAQENKLEATEAWSQMRLGEHYVFKNSFDLGERHLREAEALLNTLEIWEAQVWLENAWGLFYAFQNDYESSNLHLRKEYALAEKAQIPRAQAASMGNMGINFSKLEQLDSSMICYLRGPKDR